MPVGAPERASSARSRGVDVATIAAVYQGALDDPPWQGVVDMLCDRMDAMLMAISFRRVTDQTPPIGIQAFRGEGEKLWDLFHTRFAGMNTFDMTLARPGRILRLSECNHVDPEGLARLRSENFGPCGAGEAYCLAIGDAAALNTYLIWIKPNGCDLTPEESGWLLELAPHLSYAIENYYRTRQAELSCQALGSALGRLTIGVAAIDSNDRILFSNRIANQILRESRYLGCEGCCLTTTEQELRTKLERSRILPQAAQINGPDGKPVSILMMPIEGRDELGPGSRPERAVYFHTLLSQEHAPERLVAQLYDLTLAEAKLCVLLVDGLTLRESAKNMNVTENSVRTYSKQIFAKMGVSRQVDLVRQMILSLMLLSGREGGSRDDYGL